ncbi:hypothetical protein VTJ49DRAFT_2309 [Mycothermus thermophilus]|uniref:Tyrosinase copper-binding domain-containing protein n=1 Tax=Humicola insolens TaxID=85995 RepID=A0ABR3VR49_HUMIN
MPRPRLSFVYLSLLYLANVLALAQYGGYNYGFDVHKRVKRQLSRGAAIVVQGARVGSEIAVRQEIRQLEQDPELWTLYILALSMLQFTDQSEPTSYYGLAGIHGMPHETWGGVNPAPGSEDIGYCAHSSVLFPTWHRPYMALYEMIASFWNETERPRYQAAAVRFRHPYWDWAAPPPHGESVLPQSIGGSSFVDIDGPNGRQRIANPLYSYMFRPLDTSAFTFGPWNTWTRTLRSPSSNGPDAQSNNTAVAMILDQNRASMAQRLYALLSANDNYTTFSNNAAGGQVESIEAIHDTVHAIVGGGGPGQTAAQPGHMGWIQWSAFDPIFFLHHCMVDRIFAIWQALHPDSWIEPSVSLLGTYTTQKGATINSTTALTPFFSANGTFWDSDGVRDHTKLGYTYAELVDGLPRNNTSSRLAQVRCAKQAVNRMYGSFSPAAVFLRELRAHGIEDGPATTTQHFRSKKLPRSLLTNKLFTTSSEVDRYREWTIHVRVGKQAVASTESVSFFLGGDDKPIGTMGVFTSASVPPPPPPPPPPSSSSPMNSQQQQGANPNHRHSVSVSGTVPLTAALMDKLASDELESLEPGCVVPYLRRNLKRVVRGSTGEVVAAAGSQQPLEGLEMRVVSAVVTAPWSEEELPRWGEGKVEMVMC